MNKKISALQRIFALIVAVSCVLFICSCTSPDNSQSINYYSFKDDTGVTITLSKKPQKVAVLFSSFAEIWLLSGGSVDITVGESVERGFVDSNVLLADTGAGKTINTELLISYKPDFVICSADIDAQLKAAELLNNAGIACARFRVETFTDYMRMLKICTDITGDSDAYQKYGIDIKNEIDGLLSTVDTNYKNEKILFIRAGSSEKSAKAKTSAEHFACTMLDELGTYNIAENAPLLLDGLSIEEIVIQNPEYIFISTMGDEQAARANMERIINRPEWQSLDAVKNGRYYYLPKDLFQYKPNARWAEAYAYLAEILNEQDTH